jgi:hypothetical protein
MYPAILFSPASFLLHTDSLFCGMTPILPFRRCHTCVPGMSMSCVVLLINACINDARWRGLWLLRLHIVNNKMGRLYSVQHWRASHVRPQ